jgi:transposase
VNSSLSTKDAIRSLLSKGMSKEEVAQRLSISVGEIDLFLKLRDKGSKRRFSR